jgi:hypothetical protein
MGEYELVSLRRELQHRCANRDAHAQHGSWTAKWILYADDTSRRIRRSASRRIARCVCKRRAAASVGSQSSSERGSMTSRRTPLRDDVRAGPTALEVTAHEPPHRHRQHQAADANGCHTEQADDQACRQERIVPTPKIKNNSDGADEHGWRESNGLGIASVGKLRHVSSGSAGLHPSQLTRDDRAGVLQGANNLTRRVRGCSAPPSRHAEFNSKSLVRCKQQRIDEC